MNARGRTTRARIVAFLKDNPASTTPEVADCLGYTLVGTRLVLNDMESEGTLSSEYYHAPPRPMRWWVEV